MCLVCPPLSFHRLVCEWRYLAQKVESGPIFPSRQNYFAKSSTILWNSNSSSSITTKTTFRKENGRKILKLHHPAEAFALNQQAYIVTITHTLKCSMDVQFTDGKGMVLWCHIICYKIAGCFQQWHPLLCSRVRVPGSTSTSPRSGDFRAWNEPPNDICENGLHTKQDEEVRSAVSKERHNQRHTSNTNRGILH